MVGEALRSDQRDVILSNVLGSSILDEQRSGETGGPDEEGMAHYCLKRHKVTKELARWANVEKEMRSVEGETIMIQGINKLNQSKRSRIPKIVAIKSGTTDNEEAEMAAKKADTTKGAWLISNVLVMTITDFNGNMTVGVHVHVGAFLCKRSPQRSAGPKILLTTYSDTSGTFNLSGSIRRQMKADLSVEGGHLCNIGKMIEKLEGKCTLERQRRTVVFLVNIEDMFTSEKWNPVVEYLVQYSWLSLDTNDYTVLHGYKKITFVKNVDANSVLIAKEHCYWYEINYNDARSVISIELDCNHCSRPFDLGNLDFSSFPKLERFIINMCLLEGSIPEEIGMLSNLAKLSHRGTNFKGTLPVSITNLTKSVELDLSGNNFTSTIPSQIGDLKNLLHLDLNHNQFSGLIPSSLGSMVNLTYLDFSWNNFIGPIPSSLGSMVNIDHLDLRTNKLNGSIPSSLGFMVHLAYLDLSQNNFIDPIPSSLGSMVHLSYMDPLQQNEVLGSAKN
ncbi:MDIS1-interacting receptor like kinase 2-like protein [Tanacetum coccineum]